MGGAHFVAGQLDFVVRDQISFRPVPRLVLAAACEADGVQHVERTQRAAAEEAERHRGLVAVDLQLAELGAAIRKLQTLVLHERPAHEARGHCGIVLQCRVALHQRCGHVGRAAVVRHAHHLRAEAGEFADAACVDPSRFR